jgi:hypothetical protein
LKRRQIVDFTTALQTTETSILTSVTLSSNLDFDIIQHFYDIELTTWLLFLIFSLIISLLTHNFFKSEQVLNSISYYLWILWNIITLQNLNYKLISSKYRFLLSLTYICICFVFYYFFATINSEVVVRNKAKPIDSLEDLMHNQGMRPAFFIGTVTEEWFINNKKEITQQILRKSLRFKGSQIFSSETLIPLIENKIALIAGFEVLQIISMKACSEYPLSKFYISRKTFRNMRNGFALRKGINPYFRNKFEKK